TRGPPSASGRPIDADWPSTDRWSTGRTAPDHGRPGERVAMSPYPFTLAVSRDINTYPRQRYRNTVLVRLANLLRCRCCRNERLGQDATAVRCRERQPERPDGGCRDIEQANGRRQ